MDQPVFLSTEQVLRLHDLCIQEHGGSHGIRDLGLLEAAVAMPQAASGGNYLHEGLPAMAAAYHFHLCSNHPFVDGNKRVAVVAAEVFLNLNGCRLALSNDVFEGLTFGVAAGRVDKAELAATFAAHCQPLA